MVRSRIRVLTIYYLDDAHRYMVEIVTASPPAGLPSRETEGTAGIRWNRSLLPFWASLSIP